MTLNGVIAVTLRYFTEFGTCVPTHNRVELWRHLRTSLLYFVVRVRCRRKESSRLLAHLLMSFLFLCVIVSPSVVCRLSFYFLHLCILLFCAKCLVNKDV